MGWSVASLLMTRSQHSAFKPTWCCLSGCLRDLVDMGMAPTCERAAAPQPNAGHRGRAPLADGPAEETVAGQPCGSEPLAEMPVDEPCGGEPPAEKPADELCDGELLAEGPAADGDESSADEPCDGELIAEPKGVLMRMAMVCRVMRAPLPT